MWSRIKLSTEEQGIDCNNLLSHWYILWSALILWRLLRWLSNKESTYQCRWLKRHRFDPWVGKIPWSRKWQPTPVVLPGEPHGQRSLAGCHGVIRAKHDLVTKPPPRPHKVVRITFRNFYIKNILRLLSCSLNMTELIDLKHQPTQHLNYLASKPLQSCLALVTP